MNSSRFAPRDPAVEAALQDLGTARRDFISAYEDRRSGLTPREERAQRLQAREEQDNRRAAIDRAAATGDGTARALGAWNNSANFEADPMALRSEDIAGGQAHRRRLNEMRASGQLRDDDEPRASRGYGENRNRSAQARNISGAGYIAVSSAETGANGGHRSVSSSTPRSFPGLQSPQIPTNSNRDRPPPARPDGRVRAPSPRLLGTTRFDPGGRVTTRPAAAMDESAYTAAAARPSLPALAPTVNTTSSSPRARVAPAASASTPPRPAAAAADISPTASTTSSAVRLIVPPARGAAAPPIYTRWQPPNYADLTSLQLKALWYAAQRGSAYDNFLASHAGAARLLEDAREALVVEITELFKADDQREIARYLKTHPERDWMMEAASKARNLLQHASDDEVLAYYASNSDHTDFFGTAEVMHGSGRTVSVGMSDPSIAAAPAAVVMSSSSQVNTIVGQSPSVANGAATQAVSTLQNAAQALLTSRGSAPPAVSTTSAACSTSSERTARPARPAAVSEAPAPAPAPVRTTATVPPHLRSAANRTGSTASVAGTSTERNIRPAHPADQAPTPTPAQPTPIALHFRSATTNGAEVTPPLAVSTPSIADSTTSVAGSTSTNRTTRPTRSTAPAPVPATAPAPLETTQTAPHLRSTTNDAILQPNGSVSTASSRSSLRSAATDVTSPPKLAGLINVTYIDNDGNFVKHEQIKHYSAMNMTITVSSTQSGVDPVAAFAPFKVIAEQATTNNTPAPQAVKLVDDDIYGSDEEL